MLSAHTLSRTVTRASHSRQSASHDTHTARCALRQTDRQTDTQNTDLYIARPRESVRFKKFNVVSRGG